MRKLVYYVGMTIDGFIAAPDGGIDHFPVGQDVLDFLRDDYPETVPAHIRQALGFDDRPNRHFDTGIQGRPTYELALRIGITSPYPHLRQYVVSETITESPDPAVEIISSDLVGKVRELKAEDGLDIWLMGGGRLAGSLLPEIDAMVIKLYPVVLGAGIPVFTADFSPTAFELTGTRRLENGALILDYARKQ
ncbi:dihydrofolate reductase family protein [Bailinhaonella thermotolerans]|uniref:Dihydrofolate reductase n=1 Tax=Bailinhaonella thermotolerans TaxID=1070861 RepID=A0A3A4B4P4_9ACTN|nr:dihydrofolate reductase family protein [Bailinhaonella thermotolerans]RJL33287.1 dihydrofolate reductase [Bailinhaonella thermotolerans]